MGKLLIKIGKKVVEINNFLKRKWNSMIKFLMFKNVQKKMARKKSAIDRLDEFGEGTVVGLSIKTLMAAGATVAMMVSMYMTLQADIQVAMKEPEPPVTKTEYELQKEMMDNAIIETKEDISEIKRSIDKMEDRLFNQSRVR